MAFWCLFLDSHLTTYISNTGVQIIAMVVVHRSTLSQWSGLSFKHWVSAFSSHILTADFYTYSVQVAEKSDVLILAVKPQVGMIVNSSFQLCEFFYFN